MKQKQWKKTKKQKNSQPIVLKHYIKHQVKNQILHGINFYPFFYYVIIVF